LKSILFLHSSSDLYGASRIFLQIVQNTVQQGDRAIVILSEEGPLADEIRAAGAELRIFKLGILRRRYMNPLGVINRLYFLYKAFKKLQALIESEKIDLVYSNGTAIMIGALTCAKTKTPHIWHIHEVVTPPWPVNRLQIYLMDQVSNVQIAVSRAAENHWKSLVNKPERIIQLFNGVEIAHYSKVTSPPGEISIGMIGRVNHWKGQPYFLAIAKELGPSYSYVMAGDPYPGYEYLIKENEELRKKLNVHVINLGYVADNRDFFKNIHILILPSIQTDPLPTVILEAMAAGKPVIATRQGGALDMVEEGETGFFIPIEEPKIAAKKIRNLLENQDEINRMSLNARKRAREHFSLERFNAEITRIISLTLQG
jgi:glycosyltransferase involved in cell wall biosynthesis